LACRCDRGLAAVPGPFRLPTPERSLEGSILGDPARGRVVA
jgi:hypothetical protein